MRVENGRLVIEPVGPGPVYTLEELIADIDPSDVRPETSTGSAVGNERV